MWSVEPLIVLIDFRRHRGHDHRAAVANVIANCLGTGGVHQIIRGHNYQFVAIERAVADVDERDVDVVFEEGL